MTYGQVILVGVAVFLVALWVVDWDIIMQPIAEAFGRLASIPT